MPPLPDPIQKPERWSVPFDPNMSEADVDRLLTLTPFREMDPAAFPQRTPLRDILRYDTRLRRFRQGEIIVRQGDYGTSAFMVLQGSVRVVLMPGLPASLLGRREPVRRGFFRIMAQLWAGTRGVERVRRSRLIVDQALGTRAEGDEVRVFLQDVPRIIDQHKTALLEAGEFFGEMAALTRAPRSSSLFAETEAVELLELRWQALRDLKKYDRAMEAHIQKLFRERALSSYLRQAPVFRSLPEPARERLLGQTEFATYGRYEWTGDYKQLVKSGALQQGRDEAVIAQEGDYPNGVALIRSGFARLSRKFGSGRRTLNYLGAGRFYGFREIAHNWRQPGSPVPLQYTLSAVGCANVIVIPTRVMEEVVLPGLPRAQWPPLFSAAETAADAPFEAAAGGAKLGEDMLEFLAEHRFFNGTAAMIIDLDRCTRCDDCVRACAATHNNNPRFLRHGPIQGGIMVANACMHCADPVCMIGCPTGAIHRSAFGGEVLINKATCIGCTVCANQCPYEAIRMVEIQDEKGQGITDSEMVPLRKATKCDLCVEQWGGPACERACPHDALARLNLNDLDAFARWLKR